MEKGIGPFMSWFLVEVAEQEIVTEGMSVTWQMNRQGGKWMKVRRAF
jgi:hypothetical protein